MKKILLTFALTAFIGLSANCGMKKCDKKDCDMPKDHKEMKCDMKKDMKSGSCGTGKCGGDMKKQTKSGSCGAGKCGSSMKNMSSDMKDTKAKKCGCGMTVEDCKKMMPHCDFRDGKKK